MYSDGNCVQPGQSWRHSEGDRNIGKQGGSSGIVASESGGSPSHLANGSFAPGNKLGGRKPKALEHAYLDAMRNALPPERIESLLEDALALAQSSRSWRGIVEVVTLAMAYGAGKPVSKTVHTDGNLAELLAALSDDKPLLPVSSDNPKLSEGISVTMKAGVMARLDVAAGGDVAGGSGAVVDGEIVGE